MKIIQYLIIIMEDSNTLFCTLKLRSAREKIFSKFIRQCGHPFQKDSPALP